MRVFIFVCSLFCRQDRLITPLSPGKSEQLRLILQWPFFSSYIFCFVFFPRCIPMTFDPCVTPGRFAGGMLRVQAEAALLNRQNSTYLVRHRGHDSNEYAISIK